MKRRIINGLLALALLLPVVGGFTSCKDTDEDQFNTLKKEQYTLEEKIQKLNDALEAMKNMQSNCEASCQAMMQTMLANYLLKQDFEAYKNEVAPILQQYAALQSTVTTIQNTITTIQSALDKQEEKNEAVDLAISTINTTLTGMQTTISGMQSDLGALQTNLSNLQSTVGNVQTTVNGIQTDLSSLQTTVGELSTSLTTLTGTVTGIQQQIAPIIADWDEVKKQAYDSYTWVTTNQARFAAMDSTLNSLDSIVDAMNTVTIPQMQNDIDSLQSDVALLAENLREIDTQINGKGGILDWQRVNGAKIDSLRKDVDKLFARIDNMVTGVILQGTVNPVFGSMSLPINVQSNMLIAYWGINDFGREYDFPIDRSAQEFDNEIVITDEDWDMLEAAGIKEFFTVNEGNLVDGVGNAGRVYVTVNPNNVDFTGKILPIVNSRDEESGIVLSPLRKSDEVLTFGWSRADGAKNGFYEADATLTAENIEKVAVSIDDRLMPTLKEALKDRSKKDFAKLVKIIYDQFDGILPANGLKAAWTVDNEPFAVYSQYNLAATAFKPLSFKFMQGMSIRNLPKITPISGQSFDLDRFKIKFEMPTFTIDASGITFVPNIEFADVDLDGNLVVVIKDFPVYDDNNKVVGYVKVELKGSDVKELIAAINEAMQKTANKMNTDLKAQFEKGMNQLIEELKTQVNEMMEKVKAEINGKIEDLVNDISKELNDRIGSYINKANSLINKYNSAADRINAYLQNANNYLQVTMLVQGADGMFHNISNSANMPSPFVVAGGDALTLYLTTYTGEIAVPCFKKFVGVTNVFKGEASAQAGDADCLNALKAANATEFMNTALSGRQQRVAFEGKPGYVYELVYQGLDYHGYTSTRKFYVEVKEAEVAE